MLDKINVRMQTDEGRELLRCRKNLLNTLLAQQKPFGATSNFIPRTEENNRRDVADLSSV